MVGHTLCIWGFDWLIEVRDQSQESCWRAHYPESTGMVPPLRLFVSTFCNPILDVGNQALKCACVRPFCISLRWLLMSVRKLMLMSVLCIIFWEGRSGFSQTWHFWNCTQGNHLSAYTLYVYL